MENHTFPREISLCLSGGGTRGAYHLGVISVLEENGIAIKAISGTSIGALIGASIACGRSAQEIFELFCSKEIRKVFQFAYSLSHLFEIDTNAAILDSLIDKESFETLNIPLAIVIFDIKTQKVHYINTGSYLKKYILASCALVPIFKPIEHEDMLLIDGGIVDNFPIEQLQKYSYPIVGINLYPSTHNTPKSIIGWIKKVVYLSWQTPNHTKQSLCHSYISSQNIHTTGTFSLGDMKKAYAFGREEMLRVLDN